VPTAQTVPPAAATPTSPLTPVGLPFGVASGVHVVPFQRATRVLDPEMPALAPPTAHASVAVTASTAWRPLLPLGNPDIVAGRQAVPS